jgi:hypothetical protein
MEEPGFLELISIGIVDETGDDVFYACNWGADLDLANAWVKQNVFPKLHRRPGYEELNSEEYDGPWMMDYEIKERLLEYFRPSEDDPIELWGYYSAYDHVLLCWLFGRMVDLPEGIPMYTMDIKQYAHFLGDIQIPLQINGEHNALEDAKWNREAYLWLRKEQNDR